MGRLRAGVGASVITPPVGYHFGTAFRYRLGKATGIHDDLWAKALVLDDGETTLAIVGMDVVGISEECAETIRERVEEETGIPKENIMLNSTHNHTSPATSLTKTLWVKPIKGPRRYMDIFPDYIAGAVIEAYNHMEKASIGVAKDILEGVTVNRRHRERPIDREVGVIRVDGRDGSPMACLVNFPCHALAVSGEYTLWTADFPGYTQRFLEREIPGCTCIYLQGAAGDIHPWDWWFGNLEPKHPATFEEAGRLGEIIGAEAYRLSQMIETRDEAALKARSKTITLQGRRFPWSASELEEMIKEIKARDKPWRRPCWPKNTNIANLYHHYPSGYRYSLISFLQSLLELAREGRRAPDREAELQVFRIGDIILAANPGELFNELGRRIKEGSPSPYTFVLPYSNGSIGYIPAKEDLKEVEKLSLRDWIEPTRSWWAYGATYTCYIAPGSGERIVEETLKLIREVW